MAIGSDDDNGPRDGDRRVRALEPRDNMLQHLVQHLEDQVDNSRLRDGAAHGDPIERPIVTRRHPVYNEDSEEEDEYEPHEFPRH
ncbi:hypothetical protein GH714_017161 [Hevea brasiliensis]|uniref:Uncharacterized protein n=1 Tax=Hevea brasiliensis TaxID=3981 RepID=A0A6A6KG27_HEVBR|nr:hypothetical protein GH714_017161 [Hevea brasiliensis]